MEDNAHKLAIQQLEELGISYNEESFLQYVEVGDSAAVELFIQAGIRASAKNAQGKSALLIATAKGNTEIAQKLIAAGADASELVEVGHKKLAQKKDIWEKLSALSAVSTILVAAIGGWFTLTYNRHQAANEDNLKHEQNVISEMDIVSKMLPRLEDDKSRCGALLVIRTMSPDPQLPIQLANFYGGAGSICALQTFATTGNQQTSKPAIEALSSIANSNLDDSREAFSALSIVAGSSLQNRATAIDALTSATEKNIDAAICSNVANFRECHQRYPTGCGVTGNYDAYLNLLENQVLPPDSPPASNLATEDFSALNQRSPEAVTRQNHAALANDLSQLGEGRVVAVVGFLYQVMQTGSTSANCELTGAENVNYQLRIGFSPEIASKLSQPGSVERVLLEQTSIVAQTTPYSRSIYHPGWTLEYLQTFVGRQVKVTGQLLFNNNHSTHRDVCGLPGPQSPHCWRMSAWEVTPITQILECQSGNCTNDSGTWAELPPPKQPVGN